VDRGIQLVGIITATLVAVKSKISIMGETSVTF
jgi:hypothetical protein